MESKGVLKLVVIILILLVGYFVIDKLSEDDDFRRKMDIVKKKQDSLLQVVDSLERTAHERDMQLKALIQNNLTLLESINKSVKISKQKQDSIKRIIVTTQQKIDSLWSVNPE